MEKLRPEEPAQPTGTMAASANNSPCTPPPPSPPHLRPQSKDQPPGGHRPSA